MMCKILPRKSVRKSAHPFLLLGLASFAACAADTTDRRGTVVRDSAGIRIVENTGPLWEDGGGWRLGDHPLVDIGQLEGDEEYELARVGGALRLRSGGVVRFRARVARWMARTAFL